MRKLGKEETEAFDTLMTIAQYADSDEVKKMAEDVEQIVSTHKGKIPHDLINKFHGLVLHNEFWTGEALEIQRALANGMAIGYLLGSKKADS
jgi:hypothetical protein